MCCCGLRHTLKFNDAPSFAVNNPYILTGFRPEQTFTEALASLFALHNETLNVWTHLLSFIACIGWLLYSLGSMEDTSDKLIVSFAFICCLLCYSASVAYHLFKNLSEATCSFLLHMDYAGIVVAIFGLQCSCCYYSFYCFPTLRFFYFLMSVILVFPTLLFVIPESLAEKMKVKFMIAGSYKVRAFTFMSFIAFGIVPLTHFIIFYLPYLTENSEVARFVYGMIWAYAFFILGMVFWLLRIPECLWAGKFDIWASSHQWWHIAVTMGTVQFLSVAVGLCKMKHELFSTVSCSVFE